MITIIQPDERYIPKFGDVLWGAASDWAGRNYREGEEPNPMRVSGLMLNKLDGKEYEENGIIPLVVVCPNPLQALDFLDIERQYFENTKHKDPYTNQEVYGIVPIALLTNNPSQYEQTLTRRRHPRPDYVVDTNCHKMWEKKTLELTRFGDVLMGTGYSYGCSNWDGNCSQKQAKVNLSNGDWLYVIFWEWYNK